MDKVTLIKDKLNIVFPFLQKIKENPNEKRKIISSEPIVKNFLVQHGHLVTLLKSWGPDYEFLMHVLILLGQGEFLIRQIKKLQNSEVPLKLLLEQLIDVEKHYAFMGGLAGYYEMVLKLIDEKLSPSNEKSAKFPPDCTLKRPPGMDLSLENDNTLAALEWGIENLHKIGVISPLGGAGDRLDLKDPISAEDIPVAYLPLEGITLLEGLIRDLQAQEFLYWKIHNKQLTIPFAFMTSHEKNNDTHIATIFQKNQYFGRPQESYRRFIQPLVPVIYENGDFSFKGPLQLSLKPGGHGMLWKLAIESGIFDWFEQQGIESILIRQINNPLAAIDTALMAFAGIGCKLNKSFGFLSCERLQNTAEGMLVLREVKTAKDVEYSIINIEYTDVSQKEIEEYSEQQGASKFPTNTNILFARLKGIKPLIEKVPLPGMLINMKNKVPTYSDREQLEKVFGGRLESMMQNISDEIVDHFKTDSPENGEKLHCYVAYGKRQKTISVTKKPVLPEKPIAETPAGAFYDLLANCHDLLTNRCGMSLPGMPSAETFMKVGPSFIVRYHPALGPMYHIINQKIRGGSIAPKSELILEITEIDIENLKLDGSFHIFAVDLLGHKDEKHIIQYSRQNGKCELKNVSVTNRGINWNAKNSYWENVIEHHEKLEIVLHGNAEFYAENVTFENGQSIEVQNGDRLEITMKNGKPERHTKKIEKSTWYWAYRLNDRKQIRLTKQAPL